MAHRAQTNGYIYDYITHKAMGPLTQHTNPWGHSHNTQIHGATHTTHKAMGPLTQHTKPWGHSHNADGGSLGQCPVPQDIQSITVALWSYKL